MRIRIYSTGENLLVWREKPYLFASFAVSCSVKS